MRTVGAITIGQAPRDDVVPEMEKLLGLEVRVVQAGALDGLTREEIKALAPAADGDALITRLRDGGDVVVAKPLIQARLQACLDRLQDSADAFVILCTGAFAPFRSRRPVLLPDRVLAATVQAVFEGGRLGVIIPLPQQREGAVRRWAPVDPAVVVAVASPYGDPGGTVAAAEALRRAGVTLVVMSCAGFTPAMKAVVRDVTGVPVLLPTALIARLLAELA
jgi:protein AroM